MAARKKKELPENELAAQPAQAAASESVAVPADLLSQLMSQIQTLTQEVGDLRQKVVEAPELPNKETGEVNPEPLALEISQEEIDLAEQSPDLMPVDFYGEDLPDAHNDEENPFDTAEFESKNPGLLDAIAAFNEETANEENEPVVSAEEASELLAGFDSAFAEDESADEGGVMSADDIAAMFAASDSVAVDSTADEGGVMSADDIAAMFAAPDSVAVDSTADEGGVMSADDIAAMFAASDSEQLTDDAIAAAIEAAAPGAEVEPEPEFDDLDLDSLTEEDLVALVRQNIESQAENLDAEAAAAAEREAAMKAEAEGVMSAAEIAALLAQPDEEGGVVPSSSTAMSDADLRALMTETASGQAPLAAAQRDVAETVSFGSEESTAVRPVPRQNSSSGDFDLGAVKAVPAHLAVRAMALPVRFQDGKIVCKVAEPIDRLALDRLSKASGFGVMIEPTPIEDVIAGIRRAYAEVQDYHARYAVMSSSQRRPNLVEKLGELWKKIA